jgi:hypothetical protein
MQLLALLRPILTRDNHIRHADYVSAEMSIIFKQPFLESINLLHVGERLSPAIPSRKRNLQLREAAADAGFSRRGQSLTSSFSRYVTHLPTFSKLFLYLFFRRPSLQQVEHPPNGQQNASNKDTTQRGLTKVVIGVNVSYNSR